MITPSIAPTFAPVKISLPEVQETENEPEFQVEKILKRKFFANEKRYKWFVKWEGFNSANNSWEPEECFISEDGTKNDIWKAFESIHVRKKRSNQTN